MLYSVDPPPPPQNINVSFDDGVIISWTEPLFSSECVNIVGYVVTISTNSTVGNMTTNDTNVTLDSISEGYYNFSVATKDSANRIGNYSESYCIAYTG